MYKPNRQREVKVHTSEVWQLIPFPKSLRIRFKAECKSRGVKMTEVIQQLIKEWLNHDQSS